MLVPPVAAAVVPYLDAKLATHYFVPVLKNSSSWSLPHPLSVISIILGILLILVVLYILGKFAKISPQREKMECAEQNYVLSRSYFETFPYSV